MRWTRSIPAPGIDDLICVSDMKLKAVAHASAWAAVRATVATLR